MYTLCIYIYIDIRMSTHSTYIHACVYWFSPPARLLVILSTHVFDYNIVLFMYIHTHIDTNTHTQTSLDVCTWHEFTADLYTVWSCPTLAQRDCAANFASEFTAQPAPEARPGRWGLGRARLDPTRSNQDLRGFEGDAASNPGIKALYVEGFSEVRSVDSNAERDWRVWPKNGMRFDKAWPGDDLDFHSGQKFWEGPTPLILSPT